MDEQQRPVVIWLTAMAGLIAIMVTVGGATRLTDSGLSITEWDLILGSLPPLSAADWAEAFEKYKTIPEYTHVNWGMSLNEFKTIYWWEWAHRNLGRFIGLAFLFPLIWFSVRGAVKGGLRWRLWGLFLLICLQGAIGWYMVSSGLSERVDVSQYRLALHLGTAVILFGLIVWQVLALMGPGGQRQLAGGNRLGLFATVLVAATFAQVILGAFVAGLRAGMTYNTWPLMDGAFFPTAYFSADPHWQDAFETMAAVQFNHRIGAYILFAMAAAFLVFAWRAERRTEGAVVFGAVFSQMLLGIWTLVAAVPLWLGLAHQLGALIVLTVMIWSAYRLTPPAQHRAAPSADQAPGALAYS